MAVPDRVFPDLSEFRLQDLFLVTQNKQESIRWAMDNGLLKKQRICENGRCVGVNAMRLEETDRTDGLVWRCSAGRACRKKISIRKDSFFENSHLPVSKILQLAYLWAFQLDKQDFLMRELQIASAHTILDWKQFCRDICHEWFLLNPIVIGGSGHTVEIEESCFVRRSRLVREQWVFGGYDVRTKESFMVAVDHRNASTLLPILQKFVLPGTTAVSDLWAKYNISGNKEYQHLTVNHSVNFVDPVTHATTNREKCIWQKAKEKNKRCFGNRRAMLNNSLAEFLWRQQFQRDAFKNFISQVRQVYPDAAN
ncbi:uncharacterized protein LOC111641662 [Centruroides sculpturatus]|uniref:uncharacterized protein LOC111641662 n=1 Tax=Centruroides sculpturatus TaxID=218467 RepID=UPI000C6D82E9|nr:uncharacterized protein LOC111641662 [Centruroides sculpturatus]